MQVFPTVAELREFSGATEKQHQKLEERPAMLEAERAWNAVLSHVERFW